MKRDKLDIKSERLFPIQFRFFGFLLVLGGIISFPISMILGPVLLVAGGAILTGYRGIQFNGVNGQYRTYNSFLYLKFGTWQPLPQVEMIYVNASKTSQKIYTRVTEGSTIRGVEYNAYMLFENDAKEFLVTGRNKEKLFKKVEPAGIFFDLEIVDNTEA